MDGKGSGKEIEEGEKERGWREGRVVEGAVPNKNLLLHHWWSVTVSTVRRGWTSVPNVTAHLSKVNVPIVILLSNSS